MQVELHVVRCDESQSSPLSFQSYRIPYSGGMTVLDALLYIQMHLDPTLAFRWECSNGICGTCTVNLNAHPVLACKAALAAEMIYTLAPIANFPVRKDLVVDLESALKRLALAQPYLVGGGNPIQTQAEADASRKLRTCIECWACVSICPAWHSDPVNTVDPVGMVKLARYAADPRDNLNRPAIAEKNGLDHYQCATCQLCVGVCPQEINIPAEAVAPLKGKP